MSNYQCWSNMSRENMDSQPSTSSDHFASGSGHVQQALNQFPDSSHGSGNNCQHSVDHMLNTPRREDIMDPIQDHHASTSQGATNQVATAHREVNDGAANQGSADQGAPSQAAAAQGAANQAASQANAIPVAQDMRLRPNGPNNDVTIILGVHNALTASQNQPSTSTGISHQHQKASSLAVRPPQTPTNMKRPRVHQPPSDRVNCLVRERSVGTLVRRPCVTIASPDDPLAPVAFSMTGLLADLGCGLSDHLAGISKEMARLNEENRKLRAEIEAWKASSMQYEQWTSALRGVRKF